MAERAPRLSLTPLRRRAIRDGLIVAGCLFNAVLVLMWTRDLIVWVDALAWRSLDLHDLYSRGASTFSVYGAFRYSPAIAWLMYPWSVMPWPAFFVTFLSANLAALAILGRRQTVLLAVAFPPVLLELLNGNIHLFMALAIWMGLRWPVAWSFILLTKVTPGVGMFWFAARREWHNLAVAVVATGAIVAVGIAIAPEQWLAWFRSLFVAAGIQAPSPLPPLALRLPVAAAIVWYAGRTNRAWLVPPACVLAMPVVWLQSLALLTASFPLWRESRRDELRTLEDGIPTLRSMLGVSPMTPSRWSASAPPRPGSWTRGS